MTRAGRCRSSKARRHSECTSFRSFEAELLRAVGRRVSSAWLRWIRWRERSCSRPTSAKPDQAARPPFAIRLYPDPSLLLQIPAPLETASCETNAAAAPPPRATLPWKVKAYFKLEERGSDMTTEVRAGFTTFLTLAYILAVRELRDSPGSLDPGGAAAAAGTAATAAATAAAAA